MNIFMVHINDQGGEHADNDLMNYTTLHATKETCK